MSQAEGKILMMLPCDQLIADAFICSSATLLALTAEHLGIMPRSTLYPYICLISNIATSCITLFFSSSSSFLHLSASLPPAKTAAHGQVSPTSYLHLYQRQRAQANDNSSRSSHYIGSSSSFSHLRELPPPVTGSTRS